MRVWGVCVSVQEYGRADLCTPGCACGRACACACARAGMGGRVPLHACACVGVRVRVRVWACGSVYCGRACACARVGVWECVLWACVCVWACGRGVCACGRACACAHVGVCACGRALACARVGLPRGECARVDVRDCDERVRVRMCTRCMCARVRASALPGVYPLHVRAYARPLDPPI